VFRWSAVADPERQLVEEVAGMTEVMRDPQPTAAEAGPVLDQLLGDVEQVMLRAVVVLDADMRADEAARRLAAEELAAGPVLDRGRVTGMVTLTELLYWDSHPSAATGPWLRHGHEQGALRVRELMRRDIPIARATWPIARVAEVMDRSGFTRLPVVSDSGAVGVISRDDVIHALAGARMVAA
jgi:CBS domain-containing protein